MVGVAGRWEKGVLGGVVMGPLVGKGLGRPTPLQLYAAAAVLEGTKMAGGTVLLLKQDAVPGQQARFIWPDAMDVNGVVFELGEGVTMLERVALADAIRFMANLNMQGMLMEQAARRQPQVAKPSIVVPRTHLQ